MTGTATQTSAKRSTNSSASRTALEELAIHDQQVAEAEELPFLLEQAQKSAMADLMEARGDLQRMYAFVPNDEQDVAEAQRLTKIANTAEQAADRRWSDEVIGAQEAARRAKVRRDQWIDANLPGLVREMSERAMKLRDAKVAAIEGLLALQQQDIALAADWQRITGPYARSMQTGDNKPTRLHGWGVNESAQVSAIYGRISQRFHEVVDAARLVEIEGLKPGIPVEWDPERGGVLPGVS